MKKILLVEDHNLIVKSLTLSLSKKYDLISAKSVKEALNTDFSDIDLVLLDIGLPDGSGMDLYKQIKLFKDIPVIFLTANDEEETIIKAFDMGADDYLTKPFKTGELLARIKKILPERLKYKDIEIDTNKLIVYKSKTPVRTSSKEYELLAYFINNIGRVITREQLLQIWESEDVFVNDNTLSVNIKRLRDKLDLTELRTIKNIGYILDEEK